MPTTAVENYLKAVYHLEDGGEALVGTKSIADRLQLAPASVTQKLKALADQGLLEYVPYRGVRLTAEGRREALRTIRNHRLVELFLIRTLGFSWDEVHREAEALEHALSDEVADRIDAFLGFPKFDPHGDPIPAADGTIAEVEHCLLTQIAPGSSARLSRVLDQRPEVLRHLAGLGFQPGVILEIVREEPMNGPLILRIEGSEVVLARAVAGCIMVEVRG
jgi:DtxR family Mn-dependent transcriptional regulator